MKKLSIVVAVFAFFAMTAVAFAANTANISVTSEPIKEHAVCDKAGGFAITFDHETRFRQGDQITFDLPLNVYICRQINFRIGVGVGAAFDASGFSSSTWAGGILPTLGDPSSPLTGTGSVTSTNGGVTFLVTGNVDTSRVTINIQGDTAAIDGTQDSLSTAATLQFFGETTTDVCELAFLDQAVYGATGPGIYKPAPAPADQTQYGTPVLLEDNTLCIDVEEYDNETVNASFDSKADKYTWIPSNPQIAHVVAGNALVSYTCEKRVCGRIEMPGAAQQGGGGVFCPVIDNEAGTGLLGSNYASSGGYCSNTHRNNKVIIRTNDGAPWDNSNFSLTYTILVNGAAGDNGVYFVNNGFGAEGYDTPAAACANTSSASLPAATFYNANDAALVYGDIPTSGETDCAIAQISRAVKMTIPASNLNLNGSTNDYLWLDLPWMHFDSTLFQPGDVLEVRVQVSKAPCGEVFDGVFCIGTAGCESVATSYCLRYPYFGRTVGGAYVSAVVVDNLGSTDGTVTFTMYEQDGDMFTSSAMAVGAYSMIVKEITDPSFGWSGGPGTVGDSKSFIKTNATVSTDGCALITNATTGESISYLPRMINCSSGSVF
jgi:hypothetical protein